MRVMLFNPPIHHYSGVPAYRLNPPLGLPILASVLNQAGHYCEVTDLEALEVSPERLQSVWRKQRQNWPDVVGLTCLTSSARGCRDAIASLRAAGYDGRVVVGGVHATLFPEEPLSWGADAVITGECEANVAELFASGGNGILQGVAPSILQVPAPDWKRHNPAPESYSGNHPKVGHPEAITMWSRGCPWHCVFCGNAIFGKRPTRYRAPEAIEAELRTLKGRGIKALFVYDDELIGGPVPATWMEELSSRIAPLGLVWKAQGRCSRKHINKPLLEAMYRAGCRVVMWGIESFSPKVLKAIKKGTSVEDIWHTLRLAKEVGIKNWAFTMVGNLEEGEEELADTARALAQAYSEGLLDYRQTTVVTALPGTELQALQQRQGWFVPPPETGPLMHQTYQSTPWIDGRHLELWMRRFDQACPVGYAGRFTA